MRRKQLFQWMILALLAAFGVQPVLAQTTGRAEVQGVVRDQNQLVIPAARVSIVKQATNLVFNTITGDTGAYFIGAAPIGQYTMTVQMPGFNTWKTEFLLQVGNTVTIDAVLQVGDIATTIEVVDTVSEVSLNRTEVADVKDFDRIQQLPLNGRNITRLFLLTPGVEGDPYDARVKVLSPENNAIEVTQDGVSMLERFWGGATTPQPGLDGVEEFRIETIGSDARFSRPATVTLVSRSGTNQLHGSIFWTHRNNGAGLRARRREEGDETSKLIRNEFGVTAGGPLWLGNLYDGRDKTFWFFSYEGLRNRRSVLNDIKQVPMAEWWDGDFSQLLHPWAQVPVTLYDPFTTWSDGTREPFPHNRIPQERFHPIAASLEQFTARPNRDVNPALGENFVFFYPDTYDSDKFILKVDQGIGEKDNLSVRWTHNFARGIVEGGSWTGNPPPVNPTGGGTGTIRVESPENNVAVNWNRAWSTSVLNEVLVGVRRYPASYGTLSDDVNWADKLGLSNPFDKKGFPAIPILETVAGEIYGASRREDWSLTDVTLEDNATWIKGNHVLQFGGKVRVEHNNYRDRGGDVGEHVFDGAWTGLWIPDEGRPDDFTGAGLPSALMGLASYNAADFNRGYFYLRQNEFGLYLNDKWKVTPRLTLNLGLRWDAWTPYRDKQDRLLAIDRETLEDRFEVVTPHGTTMESLSGVPGGALKSWAARGLTWTTADSIGYPGALLKPDWNNFGPRLGISYLLTPKTVIRGSYGEYFWTVALAGLFYNNYRLPPLNLKFSHNLTFKPGNVDPTGEEGIYTWTNAPAADDFIDRMEIDTEGKVFIPPSAVGMQMMDGRKWRDSHARAWHITLEHELMRNTALRFTYTGKMGRSLVQSNRINDRETEFNYVSRTRETYPRGQTADQLRPNPNWRSQWQNGGFLNRRGYSNTHTGQVEIERRFSDGIGVQAFYVYTRSMATVNGVPTFANLYQFSNPVGPHFTSSPSYEELLRLNYINAGSLPPHRIRFNGIVDLPFGRGKRLGGDVSGGLNQVIGGWQVAFIGEWRSGLYGSVSNQLGVFGDYIIPSGDRPVVEIFGNRQKLWFAGDFDPSMCTGGDCAALTQYVPEDRSQRAIRPYGEQFDNRIPLPLNNGKTYWASVFPRPWTGSQHFWPFARNNFMTPREWNVDLSIFKHFYLTEDINLRLNVDFFNVFNHPNDPWPNSRTGLVNLGRQENEPRTIQLSLRLNW